MGVTKKYFGTPFLFSIPLPTHKASPFCYTTNLPHFMLATQATSLNPLPQMRQPPIGGIRCLQHRPLKWRKSQRTNAQSKPFLLYHFAIPLIYRTLCLLRKRHL